MKHLEAIKGRLCSVRGIKCDLFDDLAGLIAEVERLEERIAGSIAFAKKMAGKYDQQNATWGFNSMQLNLGMIVQKGDDNEH